jgi:hypothetical protein
MKQSGTLDVGSKLQAGDQTRKIDLVIDSLTVFGEREFDETASNNARASNSYFSEFVLCRQAVQKS